MNPELERVLSCPNLPSLPAVALRVIELTSDANVSLKELSRTIQHDQGLSAKVLRTVNSSFYGLRQRCATIDKALVLLGLSPVKSLALGFSLVDSVGEDADESFDYVAYWRRGLYSGIGAKLIAERAGLEIGDEVFLGGLLQDVGMVAMSRALGRKYAEVLAGANGDHRALIQHELQILDLQHPQVGAMLVQRWRLPDELVIPVKFHERPSAAPASFADHARCVGMGNYVHDALTLRDSLPALRTLYERARAWYKLTTDDVDEVIRKAGEASREVASLFRLDIGGYTDPEEVLAEAGRRAVSMSRQAPTQSSLSSHAPEGSVLAASELDPMTGTLGPAGFEDAVREGYKFAAQSDTPMALIDVVIDGHATLEQTCGEGADGEAVMGVAGLLKHTFDGHGGVVCHLSGGTFAVVLPGMNSATASALADQFCAQLRHQSGAWTAPATGEPLTVAVSVGVAAYEADTRAMLDEPRKLVVACARAVKAAQDAGGGSIRVFRPQARAA
jgi:two-component system, cell cycle response regulator